MPQAVLPNRGFQHQGCPAPPQETIEADIGAREKAGARNELPQPLLPKLPNSPDSHARCKRNYPPTGAGNSPQPQQAGPEQVKMLFYGQGPAMPRIESPTLLHRQIIAKEQQAAPPDCRSNGYQSGNNQDAQNRQVGEIGR